MHSIRQIAGAVAVPAPADWPEATWANLNTPADLTGLHDPATS